MHPQEPMWDATKPGPRKGLGKGTPAPDRVCLCRRGPTSPWSRRLRSPFPETVPNPRGCGSGVRGEGWRGKSDSCGVRSPEPRQVIAQPGFRRSQKWHRTQRVSGPVRMVEIPLQEAIPDPISGDSSGWLPTIGFGKIDGDRAL